MPDLTKQGKSGKTVNVEIYIINVRAKAKMNAHSLVMKQ
jgi:hypothetical protein